jgi:hypothetical protein
MTGPRQSFLVHVHAAGGTVLVLNVATRERVRVDGLPAIGAQIDRWLDAAASHRREDGPEPTTPDPGDTA